MLLTPRTLVEDLIQHGLNLHPTYTVHQAELWALGFLADIVLEKNHLDNIVYARMQRRLRDLYDISNNK